MRHAFSMAGAAVAAVPAHAQRTEISPYVEVGQVLTADLNSGDVLTYSQLTAGIDASVTAERVAVQANYQYQKLIPWDDDLSDTDVHSGLARASARIGRSLTLEGGALATRARSDNRGAAPGILAGNLNNIAQLYSVYAGPTLSTRIGPAAATADYRFAYNKVEVPGSPDLIPGQPRLDYSDDATSHLATASVGTRAGTLLPVGLSASGAYAREDASQLDQSFEGMFVRADAVLPVTREVAVVGGIGWDNIEVRQRDPLIGADGFPVLDGAGRFVTDPASPVRLAYDIDGIIWDAGVMWRPSPRTFVEARVGRRYGTISYTASASWQTGPGAGLQIGVYDSVSSFGRQLTNSLAALPTSFFEGGDPFGDRYNGCVFGGGTTPGGGAQPGGCLTPALQSVSTANFRARGVDAVYAVTYGNTRLGVGGGYANRRYYLPPVPGAVVYRSSDESYYAQLFAQAAIDQRSSVTGDLYANYFTSGIAGAPDVWGAGGQASYYRGFGRAYGSVSGGLYTFDASGQEADWIAQALLAFGWRF